MSLICESLVSGWRLIKTWGCSSILAPLFSCRPSLPPASCSRNPSFASLLCLLHLHTLPGRFKHCPIVQPPHSVSQHASTTTNRTDFISNVTTHTHTITTPSLYCLPLHSSSSTALPYCVVAHFRMKSDLITPSLRDAWMPCPAMELRSRAGQHLNFLAASH